MTQKYFLVYIYIYLIFIFVIKYIFYNIFFVNQIDRQTDETAFAATFVQIDTSEYYAALEPELEGSGTLF